MKLRKLFWKIKFRYKCRKHERRVYKLEREGAELLISKP